MCDAAAADTEFALFYAEQLPRLAAFVVTRRLRDGLEKIGDASGPERLRLNRRHRHLLTALTATASLRQRLAETTAAPGAAAGDVSDVLASSEMLLDQAIELLAATLPRAFAVRTSTDHRLTRDQLDELHHQSSRVADEMDDLEEAGDRLREQAFQRQVSDEQDRRWSRAVAPSISVRCSSGRCRMSRTGAQWTRAHWCDTSGGGEPTRWARRMAGVVVAHSEEELPGSTWSGSEAGRGRAGEGRTGNSAGHRAWPVGACGVPKEAKRPAPGGCRPFPL